MLKQEAELVCQLQNAINELDSVKAGIERAEVERVKQEQEAKVLSKLEASAVSFGNSSDVSENSVQGSAGGLNSLASRRNRKKKDRTGASQ